MQGDVPEQPMEQHPGVSCLLSRSSQRAQGDRAEHRDLHQGDQCLLLQGYSLLQ